MPAREHFDSPNLVARLNLPNMAYAPDEELEVYARAMRGPPLDHGQMPSFAIPAAARQGFLDMAALRWSWLVVVRLRLMRAAASAS